MTLRRAAAVRASVLLSFALFGIFLSAQAPSARNLVADDWCPEACRRAPRATAACA